MEPGSDIDYPKKDIIYNKFIIFPYIYYNNKKERNNMKKIVFVLILV